MKCPVFYFPHQKMPAVIPYCHFLSLLSSLLSSSPTAAAPLPPPASSRLAGPLQMANGPSRPGTGLAALTCTDCTHWQGSCLYVVLRRENHTAAGIKPNQPPLPNPRLQFPVSLFLLSSLFFLSLFSFPFPFLLLFCFVCRGGCFLDRASVNTKQKREEEEEERTRREASEGITREKEIVKRRRGVVFVIVCSAWNICDLFLFFFSSFLLLLFLLLLFSLFYSLLLPLVCSFLTRLRFLVSSFPRRRNRTTLTCTPSIAPSLRNDTTLLPHRVDFPSSSTTHETGDNTQYILQSCARENVFGWVSGYYAAICNSSSIFCIRVLVSRRCSYRAPLFPFRSAIYNGACLAFQLFFWAIARFSLLRFPLALVAPVAPAVSIYPLVYFLVLSSSPSCSFPPPTFLVPRGP